jgi:hypothetical protein
MSETILAGEALGNFKPWGHPTNWRDPGLGIHTTLDGFGNPGNNKHALFLMADGSVMTLTENIRPEILKALAMPTGRPNLPKNWKSNEGRIRAQRMAVGENRARA